MRLQIDYRENSRKRQKYNFESFKKLYGEKNIDIVNLKTGDIIIKQDGVDDICVERKTIKDFANSCIKRHMQDQAIRMAEEFNYRCIVIIGSYTTLLNDFYLKRFTIDQYYSNILSLTIKYKVPVFVVDTELQYAKIIESIAKYFKDTDPIEKPHIVQKTGNVNVDMLSCIPTVGVKSAEKIIDKYGTIKNIIHNVSSNELKDIKGIRKKQIKNINEVLL